MALALAGSTGADEAELARRSGGRRFAVEGVGQRLANDGRQRSAALVRATAKFLVEAIIQLDLCASHHATMPS